MEVLGVCAHSGCGDVNANGSVCDACVTRGWLCTVAVVAIVVAAAAAVAAAAVAVTAAAVAAVEDDDEDEACARCSRHGIPDRSSMISSSPSSTTHHSPAEAEINARVLAVSR